VEFLPICGGILFFLAFVALFVFLFIYQRKKERERTQALQAIAAQHGWNFLAEAPLNMIAGLENFTLFNSGHSKQIKNFMYGEASGIKAAVFDYFYVTGSGKSRHIHSQTVVYLEPPNLRVPYFSLRPENFMHKFISALGYQDIDFGQRPAFSEQYLLRGQDEPAIRFQIIVFEKFLPALKRQISAVDEIFVKLVELGVDIVNAVLVLAVDDKQHVRQRIRCVRIVDDRKRIKQGLRPDFEC